MTIDPGAAEASATISITWTFTETYRHPLPLDLEHSTRSPRADNGIPRSLPEHRVADEGRCREPRSGPAEGLIHPHYVRVGVGRDSVIHLTGPR